MNLSVLGIFFCIFSKEILSFSESKATNSKHKSALLKLEKKDPEFFKFLQENDEELLKFDESDEDDDDNDDGHEVASSDDAGMELDGDKEVVYDLCVLMIHLLNLFEILPVGAKC